MNQPVSDRFRSICFVQTGCPGDAAALQRAVRLSERTGARLSLVSVFEPPRAGILQLLADWGTPAGALGPPGDAERELEQLAETARQQGVATTIAVLEGSRFLEVTRQVVREGHDLLIKAAEPSEAIHRVLFGHVDRQLIRKCPCPVWIEKPTSAGSHDRILAAVDPAPFDESGDPAVRDELNLHILHDALLLAQIEEAELHIVHAWSFDMEMPLRSRAGLPEDVVAELGESVRKAHQQALADLVGPMMEHVTRAHLVKGPPGEEIARLAAKEEIDVIVMGTMCRSGVSGWFIGNTAETVLEHIDCSIVALKPSGFVSPIQA
jgi:universal stress protein E